ncbi:hypothetical protein TGAMA5MH_04442 [Trichoderma gamsii]|uniref:Peptidase S53 domain-containing protein n=1 Tax=Trichoderma gamsii TaxID=398673 RepID=A0A2K0TF47_9HYPO|nr:hypothetical protein TGAMA5MH_04442 [Trichoderma gamsii]
MRSTALLLGACNVLYWVSCTNAFENLVVHEDRMNIPQGWTKRGKAQPALSLPLRIGLKQQNLDQGEELLYDISNPASSNYGKHLTQEQVVDMFAPAEETVSSVISWLLQAGIERSDISLSKGKNWITTDITVAKAEQLLKTRYYVYDDGKGQNHIACEQYQIPSELSANVIDLVLPTVHFDVKLSLSTPRSARKRENSSFTNETHGHIPTSGTGLHNCANLTTLDCLYSLYDIPSSLLPASNNSYGIVEYSTAGYRPEDLDLFFSTYKPEQVGQRPHLNSIDGGYPQQQQEDLYDNTEPDLDLEYAMALVYPQEVTLFQVGDMVEGASYNNYLDAIDGSYCTYDGGDDPQGDRPYPDPQPGGYNGTEACGTFPPTHVISSSWSLAEDLPPHYMIRQCHEYMKLGLQGVTILYPSGDYGVAGLGKRYLQPDGESLTNGTYGRFLPLFPGDCPFVTTVGATQVIPGTDLATALAKGMQPEMACEVDIYSGGGFSNVFSMPAYQAEAVSHYLTQYPPPYGADRFNTSGNSRGLPDVSANGALYNVAVDGSFQPVSGTSAATPVFGSVIALINGERLKLGKKPVGFINPVLYAHPYILNDVTEGNNPGCGTSGFEAQPGWDPVTGLGTPNFKKMLTLFLNLP